MLNSGAAWANEEFEKAKEDIHHEQLGFEYLYEKFDINISQNQTKNLLSKFSKFFKKKWNFIHENYEKDSKEYNDQINNFDELSEKYYSMYNAFQILKSE